MQLLQASGVVLRQAKAWPVHLLDPLTYRSEHAHCVWACMLCAVQFALGIRETSWGHPQEEGHTCPHEALSAGGHPPAMLAAPTPAPLKNLALLVLIHAQTMHAALMPAAPETVT